MSARAAADKILHFPANSENREDGLVPIGYVRSRYGNRNGIPVKRGVSRIRVLDPFVPGLKGLMTSSHIIVLGHLHLAERDALKASPRLSAFGKDERGIFSVRSPARPNPIGYTVVRLLGMDQGELIVEGLDFIDGTPVMDIKPYSPGWDSIHSATRVRRVPFHEMDPCRALDLLVRDAVNFSGALEAEGARAVLMVFLLSTKYRIEPRNPSLNLEVNRYGTALDALIGMCGATFGSGRIRVVDSEGPSLRCRFDFEETSLVMRAREEEDSFAKVCAEAADARIEVHEL